MLLDNPYKAVRHVMGHVTAGFNNLAIISIGKAYWKIGTWFFKEFVEKQFTDKRLIKRNRFVLFVLGSLFELMDGCRMVLMVVRRILSTGTEINCRTGVLFK